MKKFSKSIALALCLVLGMMFIVSCDSGKVTYKTDVAPSELYNALSTIIKTDKDLYIYAPNEGEYNGAEYIGTSLLRFKIKTEENAYLDCFVCNTGGNSCFEYGVFRCESAAKTTGVKKALEDYITALAGDELALSYSPDDKLILENAKVTVIGNYVVYAILPEESANTLVNRVTDMLTAK